MSLVDRDAAAADALLTDLYLDAVLAGAVLDPSLRGASGSGFAAGLDPLARSAADRLRNELTRVHPSFRFEERLATRLAEAAVAMRLPAAAGAEGRIVEFRTPTHVAEAARAGADPIPRDLARPLLIGGALTSAALSIAGAALVAWRRGRPGRAVTPMARAARVVRGSRSGVVGSAARRSARRPSPPWPARRLD
jgi:hypothetical protein